MQELSMSRSQSANLRTLAAVALTMLASGAGAEPPARPHFQMFVNTGGGEPRDVLMRWSRDCEQDAAGTYVLLTAIASKLQLNADQQAALNPYIATFCTPPSPPAVDPAALEADARLVQI